LSTALHTLYKHYHPFGTPTNLFYGTTLTGTGACEMLQTIPEMNSSSVTFREDCMTMYRKLKLATEKYIG